MLLLAHPQKRQGSADFTRIACIAMARSVMACKRGFARVMSQIYVARAHHFRTPSPDGRQALPRVCSPVFFCSKSGHWRSSADSEPVTGQDRKTPPHLMSAHFYVRTDTGVVKCHSKYGPSSPPQLWAYQPAETQAQTKRLSVVPQVRVWPSSQTVARLRVRPSALRATTCTAKPTQANATDAGAPRFINSGLRTSKLRKAVLDCTQWAPKAQLRGKFYETSNLHFCSVRRHVGWRMHQARRIQSWHDIAAGPAHGELIQGPRLAATSFKIAVTVPFIRGGQLRLSNQKTFSNEFSNTGDCTCSKRS